MYEILNKPYNNFNREGYNMRIQSIQSNNNNNKIHHSQSFGHSIRVNICVIKPDGSGYDFVSPAKNTKLYKKLNAKLVGWLNEDFNNRIRVATKRPKKVTKKQSASDRWFKSILTKLFYNVDSDYRNVGIARSVYDKYGLGHIVTGVDVPVIERIKGARDIGLAKSDSIRLYGTSHSDNVEEVVKAYQRSAKKYVNDPINILRGKDGKEIKLDLNFRIVGQNKKGENIYELDNYNFQSIKKSDVINPDYADSQRKKMNIMEYLRETIRHQIKQITKKNEIDIDIDKLLATENHMLVKRKSRTKLKDDPNQLSLNFED